MVAMPSTALVDSRVTFAGQDEPSIFSPETRRKVVEYIATGGISRPKPEELKVPRGQITFDFEGKEGGRFHSRKPHVPGDTSGVTIGRGYDLKERRGDKIIKDLVAAGLTRQQAEKYADGTGLKGAKAREFIEDHSTAKLAEAAKRLGLKGEEARQYVEANLLVELTGPQQKNLFGMAYDETEKDVIRISNKDDVREKYGNVGWDKLNPAIKDVLIDLRFRGDYTPAAREQIQPLVVNNDLKGFTKALGDRKNWENVPEERFRGRASFLQKAVNSGVNSGNTPLP
jgi:hypothetical protein